MKNFTFDGKDVSNWVIPILQKWVNYMYHKLHKGKNPTGSSLILSMIPKDYCTMVILHREGRKKFGFSSKPNHGVIVNAKSMLLCQNGSKMH